MGMARQSARGFDPVRYNMELDLLRDENAQLRHERDQLRQQVVDVTTMLIKYVGEKVQMH